MTREPGKPGEFFWEGVVDQALGEETERHIAEQKAALEANPLDPRPYYHLGLLYHLQRKMAEAIEMFEHALAADPSFSAAHQALGQVYAVQGDYARAWVHARKAAALGNPSLLEQLQRYPKSTSGNKPGSAE